jgi:hypothetical protein
METQNFAFFAPRPSNGLSDRRAGAEYLSQNPILESSSDPKKSKVLRFYYFKRC